MRVAIYFVPSAESPLAQAAEQWLGRDNFGNRVVRSSEIFAGLSSETVEELTKTPRHYGFHATIKPPFHLAEGVSVTMITNRLARFCADRTPFLLPPLRLDWMAGFFCLRPVRLCQPLDALAAEAVQQFDDLRRSPTGTEIERRRQQGLSERQEKMLLRWGYPYVMEEFRCHFTLTGRVTDCSEKERVAAALTTLFSPDVLGESLFTHLSLSLEEEGGGFVTARTFPFAGSSVVFCEK